MKLLGKAFDLEQSLLNFERHLKEHRLEVEFSNPLHDIEQLWSIHLRSKDYPSFFTNGKGLSKQAAVASALGEFFERLSQLYFFSNYYVGKNEQGYCYFPQEVLVPAKRLDPYWIKTYLDGERDDEAFLDLGSGEDSILCLPFADILNDKQKLVPVNLLTNLFGSNGMAAGNTREEALVQAISEIIERHVKYRIIAESIALPQVPLSVLQRYPAALESIEALERAGHSILIQDASLGGTYPVINVTLIDRQTSSIFASFGAHPKFQVALERTLSELCQGRKIGDFARFPTPSWSFQLVADPNNLEEHFIDSDGLIHWDFLLKPSEYEFADWNWGGSIEDELSSLLEIMQQDDRKVLVFEADHLGVPTVRVIVPEMSEVYPIEDMLLNNCSRHRFMIKPLMQLEELESDELEELLSGLEELDADPLAKIAPMIGLIPDPNSGWDSLHLVELRALICIRLGDAERLQENLELWQMADNKVPQLYHLLLILLQRMEDEDSSFEDSIPLEKLFSSALLEEAKQRLTRPFSALSSLGQDFKEVSGHQRMVQLLRLTQRYMRD